MNTANVTTPKNCQKDMVEHALLPRTLLGGTPAMRKAGKLYLPQEPKESKEAYDNRLARTTLYNAFGKAIAALRGKLFAKPIALESNVPSDLIKLLEDVDGQDGNGRDFNRFLSHVTFDALAVGLTHILVDMPPRPKNEAGEEIQLTMEQAKAIGHRPRWLHYKLEDLISWRTDATGRVSRVVLSELVTVDDGEWGESEIQQYRVLTPGFWVIYRLTKGTDGKEEWTKFEQGTTDLTFIPLVTIYAGKQTGLFCVDQPLLSDLAHLNVAHWQSSSDQRHILHVARVPILFGTGWDDKDDDEDDEIGPNRCILQPREATLEYVEHTGSAIGAGEKDIEKLQDQMSVMAMEPLVPRTGNQTATAKAIDTAEATSALQDIAQGLKDAVEQLLVCTGAWYKVKPEACGEVLINADFNINMGSDAAFAELGKARLAGDISREAYIKEFQRRDLLSADYDMDADKAILDNESAAAEAAAADALAKQTAAAAAEKNKSMQTKE